MDTNSTPSGDFNRDPQPATSGPPGLVEFLTTYSRMTVSPEESDRQLERAYGKGRTPGYEGRRWDRARSQEGKSPREPDPHGACEQCGEPLTWGVRFCSQGCYREWIEATRPEPPTREETLAEMQEALDRLRQCVEAIE